MPDLVTYQEAIDHEISFILQIDPIRVIFVSKRLQEDAKASGMHDDKELRRLVGDVSQARIDYIRAISHRLPEYSVSNQQQRHPDSKPGSHSDLQKLMMDQDDSEDDETTGSPPGSNSNSKNSRSEANLAGSELIWMQYTWRYYVLSKRWIAFIACEISSPVSSNQSDRSRTFPREHEPEINDADKDDKLQQIEVQPPATSDHAKRLAKSTSLPSLFKDYASFITLFDWPNTKLGAVHKWPDKLQQSFYVILIDPRPTCLYWADQRIILYNETFAQILGKYHPNSMGYAVDQVLPNMWKQIDKELMSKMHINRRSFVQNNVVITYCKAGEFMEERSFNMTTIPMLDTDMKVVGAYQSLLDVTVQSAERNRSSLLSAIGQISAKTESHIWSVIREKLSMDDTDLPQALLYSVDKKVGDETVLVCNLVEDINCVTSGAAKQMELYDPVSSISRILRHSLHYRNPLYLSERLEYAKSDIWLHTKLDDTTLKSSGVIKVLLKELAGNETGDPCDSVVIMPIRALDAHLPSGFIIFGLATRRPYDEHYHSFMKVLQQSISTVVKTAQKSREGAAILESMEQEHAELNSLLTRQKEETKSIEERFSKVARYVPIGLCIYNSDGSMAFANNKWYSLTDFPEEADKSSPGWWSPVVYPDDLPYAFSSFGKLQVDKVPIHFEIRLSAPSKQHDATFTWVLVSAYPEMSDAGELESIIACFTDITEQKFAADIERSRTEDALEAKRQQECFVDITSHEIRNPLSVSLQCSEEIEAITKAALPPANTDISPSCLSKQELQDILHAAEVIKQCTIHQKSIVDDILTLSKMEAGMLPFNLASTEPLTVANNTLLMFSRESNHHGIHISMEVEQAYKNCADLEWLELDPGRLSQMLINLMTNAIKFTKSAKVRRIKLKLTCSTSSDHIEEWNIQYLPTLASKSTPIGTKWDHTETVFLHFQVTDSGCGISSEDHSAMFARFSQGDVKSYTQYGGSGLGLYICRSLVEHHGGRIGFRSEHGVGSSFAFCIKTRRVDAPSTNSKPTATILHPKNYIKRQKTITPPVDLSNLEQPSTKLSLDILIVEDNLINQKILKKQLEKAGHRIRVANHGGECLDILSSCYFATDSTSTLSIILMDVEMPVMNGITCTTEIRKRELSLRSGCHLPIIATTGNARHEKVHEIMEAGVDSVILKPFSIPDILTLMGQLISEFRASPPPRNTD